MYCCIYHYRKRGYFRWGKISRKRWQDISRRGNFHHTTSISFITAYGFYFRMGVIFVKKTKVLKTQKLPPRENFHIYSIQKQLTVSIYFFQGVRRRLKTKETDARTRLILNQFGSYSDLHVLPPCP